MTKTSWARTGSSSGRSTFLGTLALLQWGTLALLTTLTGRTPPLQLTAMAFAVGSLVGFAAWLPRRYHPRRLAELPTSAWCVGVGGLFGYHLLFFLALRSAPVMEANLINYLWPLLMVLFSAFLPGEALRPHHLVGTLLGFLGAGLILTGGGGLHLEIHYLPGFLAALGAALVWSSYSVLSRHWPRSPARPWPLSAPSPPCWRRLPTCCWKRPWSPWADSGWSSP